MSASVYCFSPPDLRSSVHRLKICPFLTTSGIDRSCRIDGGGREDEGVGVEELRRRLVVRAEGQLRFVAGRKVEAEQLVVAADRGPCTRGTPRPGRSRARSRQRRPRSGSAPLRSRGRSRRCRRWHCEGPRSTRAGRPSRTPATRVRRRGEVVALLDLAGDDVLQDQRSLLLGAHEVGDAVARRRPGQPGDGVPASARERRCTRTRCPC